MALAAVEKFGIVARYASRCWLCGKAVSVGDRIFKLPAKRRGNTHNDWVCGACRYPSTAPPQTLQGVVNKVAHRINIGRPVGLNKADTRVLLEFFGSRDFDGSIHLDQYRAWQVILDSQLGLAANVSSADIIELFDALVVSGDLEDLMSMYGRPGWKVLGYWADPAAWAPVSDVDETELEPRVGEIFFSPAGQALVVVAVGPDGPEFEMVEDLNETEGEGN